MNFLQFLFYCGLLGAAAAVLDAGLKDRVNFITGGPICSMCELFLIFLANWADSKGMFDP